MPKHVAQSPDLKDPDLYVQRVPHELFAQLRKEDPVYWNPEVNGRGFWALTRHADIIEVSRRPDLFSSAFHRPMKTADIASSMRMRLD